MDVEDVPYPLEETAVAVLDADPITPAILPAEHRYATAAKEFLAKAKTYVVTTLEQGYADVRAIREKRNEWKKEKDPHILGAQEAKRIAETNRKRLVTEFEAVDNPMAEAEKIILDIVGAEEDRIKVEVEKERLRLQAVEDQRAIEATLQEAIVITEEAGAIAQYAPEEAQALVASANKLLDEPVFGQTVTMPSVRPSTAAGISRPETWTAEVYDLDKLLVALTAKKLNPTLAGELRTRITEAISGDRGPLGIRAKADKAALNIPGVRAVSSKGTRIR